MKLTDGNYIDGDIKINGNYFTIEELGGWHSYLDDDEDYVYVKDPMYDMYYSDTGYAVSDCGVLIGYAIIRRALVREGGITMVAHDLLDLGIDDGDYSRGICELLLDFMEAKAYDRGAELITVTDTKCDGRSLFKELLAERGLVAEGGIWRIKIDNPEARAKQELLTPKEGEVIGDEDLRLLDSYGFTVTSDVCNYTAEDGTFTITVDRKSGEILYTGPFTVYKPQNITNTAHRMVISGLINHYVTEGETSEIGRTYTLGGTEYEFGLIEGTNAFMLSTDDIPHNPAACYVPMVQAAKCLGIKTIKIAEYDSDADIIPGLRMFGCDVDALMARYALKAHNLNPDATTPTDIRINTKEMRTDIRLFEKRLYLTDEDGRERESAYAPKELLYYCAELTLADFDDGGECARITFKDGHTVALGQTSPMLKPLMAIASAAMAEII